jgi:hypothetical protein
MSSVEPVDSLRELPVRGQATRWVVRASFASACLGWMFDAMDLQIFTLILVWGLRCQEQMCHKHLFLCGSPPRGDEQGIGSWQINPSFPWLAYQPPTSKLPPSSRPSRTARGVSTISGLRRRQPEAIPRRMTGGEHKQNMTRHEAEPASIGG